MRNLLLLTLSALLLFSCKKGVDVPAEDIVNTNDTSNSVYKYIKKLGYRDSEIKDIGNEFLVDGDILFAKNSNPDFSIFGGPRAEQYGTANYVGYNVQPNITVRIDPSMNAYTNEINGAIAMWNNVINCRVTFALTTATNQNILITNASIDPAQYVCGAANYPINGQPGSLVRIDLNVIASNTFIQRQRTIAHELGHTIGFRHTNWFENGAEPRTVTADNGAFLDAMHIMGTPTGTDANSLMNGRQCGSGATALSNFDIIAAQFLYPENPPAAGTAPVFRYYSRTTSQDHLYTRELIELGNGSNNNYIFEGIGFFAFPNQVSGSVPVYRYYHVSTTTSTGDHFYTTNTNEVSANPQPTTYRYEGIAFYAYPSPLNGSLPVYRYYNEPLDDHFYTKNQNEITSMTGYKSEPTAFWVY